MWHLSNKTENAFQIYDRGKNYISETFKIALSQYIVPW